MLLLLFLLLLLFRLPPLSKELDSAVLKSHGVNMPNFWQFRQIVSVLFVAVTLMRVTPDPLSG